MFVSQLSAKKVQRFINLLLLPAVRQNIGNYGKLNYHLYMALKKCIFKAPAFFKGFLLPLAAEQCTAKEAAIVGSILAKCSIPILDSSAALVKLCEMEYSIGSGHFIKVLIGKKYQLPSQVTARIVEFLHSFVGSEDPLPVMWHQTLLVFVQNYKYALTHEQRKKLKELTKAQEHHLITPEIRKELYAQSLGAVKREDE
jgi:essential nuclear protein 1